MCFTTSVVLVLSEQTLLLFLPAAPNGVPVNVTATVDDSSSYIFVEWMEIPCMYRNGEITGYTVMYKSTTDSRQRNVSTAGFIVTIPNLEPGKYRVSVAGMNADGLGPCSKNISVIIIAQPPTGITCYSYCRTVQNHEAHKFIC